LALAVTNWFIALGFPEWVASDNIDRTEIDSRTGQQALFALIVKTLGIFFTVNGLTKLPHAISQANIMSSNPNALAICARIFSVPVMSIVLGGLCFFAADLFTNLAFPKSKRSDDGESADPFM
jgi:hypothetical protein